MKLTQKYFLASFLGLVLSEIGLSYTLPNIGSSSGGTISTVQESDIGKQFIQMVRAQLPLLQDPLAENYIQNLGQYLVRHSNMPKKHFTFFIVKDSSINAFSGPDGYVGVNTGLILTTQSEGELAAVMSHEIAHVTQRHIARMIGQQKNMQLANLAALLGAVAVGMKNPQAGAGMATAATAGNIQTGLNFSRGYEREADQVGMQTLARSGYSPENMPAFFERMQEQTKLNGTENVPAILLTHPLTAERLADAENRAQLIHVAHPISNNALFYLIQSRILVDTTNDAAGLADRLQAKLQQKKDASAAMKYAYVLALTKSHQLSQASNVAKQLVAQYPKQVLFKIALVDILNDEHQTQNATSLMKAVYQQDPKNYAVILTYANLLISNGQFKTAADVLAKEKKLFAQNEMYLSLLSQAQGRAGDLVAAYETRADLLLLYNDEPGAILQLQQALQFTKDQYQRARIQYRINQLKIAS